MDIAMRPKEAAGFLREAILKHYAVLMTGSPGIGKTALVNQISKSLNEAGIENDFYTMTPVTSEAIDFKGVPFILKDSNEAEFLPFGDLKKLINAKKLTIVLLDDLICAINSVQAAAMHLVHARDISGHKISPHVSFVACANRKADKAGGTGIIEPFKSRFHTIINLEPSLPEWSKWANEEGLPIELTSFFNFRPELLNDFHPTTELTNSPSPRTAHHVGDLLRMNLPKSTEYKTIVGAAGEGFATELSAFLEIWRDLPDIGAITLAPETVDVPDQPATLYALSGALSEKMGEQTMAPIMTYLKRMPEEFQVLTVRNAIQRRGKEICNTKEYTDFIVRHQDLLFPSD